jgi:hypothetical protein
MNIFFIISIICLALCFLMFFYLKWYIKKRTSSSWLEEHRNEVNKLIADIDSVTDRDSQLVEDRINELKTLLQDVDARIAVYEKDLEDLSHREVNPNDNKQKAETLYTSLGRGIRSALETPQVNPKKPQLEPPRPTETIAPPVAAVPVQAVSPPPLPSSKPPSKKQIRSFIDLLAGEGLSPQEIASRLDISIAEVTLAMNLRRQKRGGK